MSSPYELLTSAFVASCFALSLYTWTYRRGRSRGVVELIPGPASESFLTGHMLNVHHGEVGTCDSDWIARFGSVLRIKGCFGNDIIFIADPKALRHIFSGYTYLKPSEMSSALHALFGPGVLSASDDNHKRHRRAMQPAFGGPQVKNLAPVFAKISAKMTQKWRDIFLEKGTRTRVVDIPEWTTRASLDAIGEAGFDYDFGALDDPDTVLAKGFQNFMLESFGKPSRFEILLESVMSKLPSGFISLLLHLPTKAQIRRRRLQDVFDEVAEQLLTSKVAAMKEGRGGNDVMSLLVTANVNGREASGLSTDEMMAQMRTLLIAGHETVSGTMSWALLRLAQNPDVQSKLRSEIQGVLAASSNVEVTESDVDKMPYLQAFVKEVLRLEPLVPHIFRVARSDDVLPLSKPVTLSSGETVMELPIKKGQQFITSLYGYNRYSSVWGPDADVFDPERWLRVREEPEVRLGVHGNMLTFLDGSRHCIGWKFALLELHIFLVEIVKSVEVSLPEDSKRIFRLPSTVMSPIVEGEFEKGVHLPLRLTLVD